MKGFAFLKNKFSDSKKRVYLDYAATTPLSVTAYKAMKSLLKNRADLFGNPGSLHRAGQQTLAVMDRARDVIAEVLTAHRDDIIFTGSATEANNLIIRGVLKAFFRNRKTCATIPNIVVSAIEHPSILETVADIEKDGSAQIRRIPVSPEGVIDTQELKKALDENTILVSVMWVNNETGVIQPVKEVVDIVREFRASNPYPVMHTDAVQAAALFDLNVIKSGVDAVTISGHKVYGPKGIGALYIRKETREQELIVPMITGGDQEFNMRAGTQNVISIVGFAAALKECAHTRRQEYERLAVLNNRLREGIEKNISGAVVNGTAPCSPHILNIFIPSQQSIATALDVAGVAVSAGAACSQRRNKGSSVLEAMKCASDRIKGSIRLSLGKGTTAAQIDRVIARIIMIVK